MGMNKNIVIMEIKFARTASLKCHPVFGKIEIV
jgi:hypothetical protein